uniref:Uncharacterized protein n=1 Tax=Anopheles christyi TaxID=43041 RepID=A0A182JV75_9DIPT
MSKLCCNNPKNLFCFVCGLYTPSHHKRSIMTRPLLQAYEAHFKVRTSQENYLQGPPSVCNPCNNALLRWQNGMCPKPELPFAIPMLWSAPSDHLTDCYFCLTRAALSKDGKPVSKQNPAIVYPSVKSAIRPKIFQSLMPHPVHCTISTPPAANGKMVSGDNIKMIALNTNAKFNDSAAAMQQQQQQQQQKQIFTRHSLPILQPAPVSVQLKTVPNATSSGGVKRKADPNIGVTYGVTKVRLRNSEPSVVLEKTEKLLPSKLPAAGILRRLTTGTNEPPKILNVFSLNKNAVNCDTKQFILPAMKPQPKSQRPETIEIDDEAEEMQRKDAKEHNLEEQRLPKAVQIKQEKEAAGSITAQPPTVPQQIAEVKVVKVERQSPTGVEQKAASLNTKRPGFINLCDLATSSTTNGMMVVKMPPVTETQQTAPVLTAAKVVTSSSSVATTPDSTGGSSAEPEDQPHRITQSELILLLRELELPKEKSAILIDRLKKWNLLAIELVGSNRSRASDAANGANTVVSSQQSTVSSPPPVSSAPAVSAAAAAAAAVAAVAAAATTVAVSTSATMPATTRIQCGQFTGTVTSLSKMKDLQVRSTRAGISKPPIKTSSANGSNTRPNIVIKQGGETKSVPKVITTSVTTRSAKIAQIKQNCNPASKIK